MTEVTRAPGKPDIEAKEQLRTKVIVAGRPPIPEAALPEETVRTVIDRVLQANNVPVPPSGTRQVTWRSHGQGGHREMQVNEDSSLRDLGVQDGDDFVVSWPATNG